MGKLTDEETALDPLSQFEYTTRMAILVNIFFMIFGWAIPPLGRKVTVWRAQRKRRGKVIEFITNLPKGHAWFKYPNETQARNSKEEIRVYDNHFGVELYQIDVDQDTQNALLEHGYVVINFMDKIKYFNLILKYVIHDDIQKHATLLPKDFRVRIR